MRLWMDGMHANQRCTLTVPLEECYILLNRTETNSSKLHLDLLHWDITISLQNFLTTETSMLN